MNLVIYDPVLFPRALRYIRHGHRWVAGVLIPGGTRVERWDEKHQVYVYVDTLPPDVYFPGPREHWTKEYQ